MKLHYYIFTFQYPLVAGGFALMNSMQGFEKNCITLSGIKNAKLNAGVSLDSIVIGVSYLGHMTSQEFKDAE